MKKEIILRRRTFYLLIIACILSFAYNLNVVRQVSAKENSLSDKYQYLKTFTDVLALVEKNYVEPVNLDTLVEGAIKGMLLTLDPHSGYMDREVFKELQVETKGEFGGLGIEITVKDGLLTVVAPIEDSPAARAGLKAGDQIIKIGDEFTKNLSLIDAVKKMRGPKGSPVNISVHREGAKELIPITVIRDIIRVKSVRSRPLEDGYGYVRIAQFQDGSEEEFRDSLKKLGTYKDKEGHVGLRGLVVDLRNDPGGLLTQAVRVSDIFLKEGVIVYTDGRLESQKQKYYAHDDSNEPEFPMVVIVNGGSASASEIVAGAMQDHGRALILGQQTFGKGSVQTIFPLEDDDALRLTTALYYTKSGRSIQAQGISPDIVVSEKKFPTDSEEVLEEDEGAEPMKERDLPGALKNPHLKPDQKGVKEDGAAKESEKEQGSQSKSGAGSKKKAEPERVNIGSESAMTMDLAKLLRDDPQLAEALRLLKTWNVFQGKPTPPSKVKEAAQAQTNG